MSPTAPRGRLCAGRRVAQWSPCGPALAARCTAFLRPRRWRARRGGGAM